MHWLFLLASNWLFLLVPEWLIQLGSNNMDKTRNQLKTMNRQFGFYMAQKTAMKNNLISLLDQTYPGANDLFDSPAQRWQPEVEGFRSYLLARGLRP